MATIAELAATMRQGLLDGLTRTVDADQAEKALRGLFMLEAQRNSQDPYAYSIPEEMQAMAADYIVRVVDDAWAVGDTYAPPP